MDGVCGKVADCFRDFCGMRRSLAETVSAGNVHLHNSLLAPRSVILGESVQSECRPRCNYTRRRIREDWI